MFKQMKVWLVLTVVLSLLAVASSCSKAPTNDTADTNTGSTGGETYQSKGDEGTVSGVIAFTGTAPAPKVMASPISPSRVHTMNVNAAAAVAR